jgi:hypothetical protein
MAQGKWQSTNSNLVEGGEVICLLICLNPRESEEKGVTSHVVQPRLPGYSIAPVPSVNTVQCCMLDYTDWQTPGDLLFMMPAEIRPILQQPAQGCSKSAWIDSHLTLRECPQAGPIFSLKNSCCFGGVAQDIECLLTCARPWVWSSALEKKYRVGDVVQVL